MECEQACEIYLAVYRLLKYIYRNVIEHDSLKRLAEYITILSSFVFGNDLAINIPDEIYMKYCHLVPYDFLLDRIENGSNSRWDVSNILNFFA